MPTSPPAERLKVLVASDHALFADTVRAALVNRGHDVAVVRWPNRAHPVPRRRRPPPTAAVSEVGLLLCDLDRWSRIRAATLVVERIRVPWLALTTSPRGPAWGGLLAAGVEVVLPGNTRLERISDLLLSVVRRQVATPPDERTALERAWRESRDRHGDVTERIGHLSPRERDVLNLMYAGSSVADIARTFEVTPATVRSQVKAVLRKLDVNSQLAAVAALDDALDGLDERNLAGPPVPQPEEAATDRDTDRDVRLSPAAASRPGVRARRPPAGTTP